MKYLYKNISQTIIGFLLIFNLISCTHLNDFDEEIEKETYQITLGFGLSLEPSGNGIQAKSYTIEHNYSKIEYIVEIDGDLVGGGLYLEDVDLNEQIVLEVTGPIIVSVRNSNFSKNELSDVAYFGLDAEVVETDNGNGVISVPLELAQGFVMVTKADDVSDIDIRRVEIDNDEVDLDQVFYTAKDGDVEVDVRYKRDDLRGSHRNVIGEGVVYLVERSGGGPRGLSNKTDACVMTSVRQLH